MKTNKNDKLIAAETRAAASYRIDILTACSNAVACIERYAAEARVELERAKADATLLVALPGAVLYLQTTGMANAVSGLNTAIRMGAEYTRALGIIEGAAS